MLLNIIFPFTSHFWWTSSLAFFDITQDRRGTSGPKFICYHYFFRVTFHQWMPSVTSWQIIFPKVWKDPLHLLRFSTVFEFKFPVILLSTISSFCQRCQWTHPRDTTKPAGHQVRRFKRDFSCSDLLRAPYKHIFFLVSLQIGTNRIL